MADLYQIMKLLDTKSSSKINFLKRAIESKNGTIIDPHSMKTVPDELRSILTVVNTNGNTCRLAKSLDICNGSIKDIIFNEKTGLVVILIENSTTYFLMNTKEDFESSIFIRELKLPPNSDPLSPYTSFVTEDILNIYAMDDYFIASFTDEYTDGKRPEYYSSDGILWKNNITELISGYNYLVDSIIATFPWGGQVLSGDLQYTIDIVNHNMKISENQNQIPSITHECVLFDTVAVLVPRSYNEMDSLKCLYYVLLNEPFTIRFAKLPTELTKNVSYVFLALKTAKNTLCIVGCDADKSKTIMVELFINMHDDNNLYISYRTIPLEFNNSSMIYGTTIGRYTFVNINDTDIYYSEDIDNWQLGYSIDGDSITEILSNENSLKVFYDKSGIKCDIMNISIIDAYDVPIHKSFLNSNGELIKGQVGYSQYALFSSGKLCNMEVNEHVLFDNRLIFDPRENMNSICQIIFFNNEYYFLLGYKKHYALFRSLDGNRWSIIHELTNNKLPNTDGNYNRWKMIIIDGELCLVKVGTVYDTNHCMRFDINGDTVTQIFDPNIIWKYENSLDEISYGNLTYLYHACNGVMCGYGIDQKIFTKIMVVNNYGYSIISDTGFSFNHIIEISNKDDAVLLVSDNGCMYLEDEKVYYTTNINLSQTDLSTFRIFAYENYLITIEKSYWGMPFIHFYEKEETVNAFYETEEGIREYPTIVEIPISSLPSELTLFYKRSYLPKAYIKDNLLHITDFEGNEPAFTLDMENRFRVVRYEDNSNVNKRKFIQYCFGKVFTIDTHNKIRTSTTRSLSYQRTWVDMAASVHGYFAICEEDNYVYYSEDGLSYEQLSEYGNFHCNKIVAGGNQVIVASTQSNPIEICRYSTDRGKTWDNLAFPIQLYLQNIEMEKDDTGYQLVIFAKINEYDPYNVIWTTNDGVAWHEISVNKFSSPIVNKMWRDVTCDPKSGIWVAISTNDSVVVRSDDGVSWTRAILPVSQKWDAVVYTDEYFFAVSRESNIAGYSSDGNIWYDLVLPSKAEWTGCSYGTYNGSNVIVVIASNSNKVLVGDSIFRLHEYDLLPNYDWMRIIYQDNKFVAIPRNNRYCAYSEDGYSWYEAALPVSADWRFLLYASGVFVIIDSSFSNMAASINGKEWLAETIEVNRAYRLIGSYNSKFMVFEFTKSDENGVEDPNEDLGYIYEYIGSSDTLKEWITCAFEHTSQTFASLDGIIITRESSDESWYDISLPLTDSGYDFDWLTKSIPMGGEWSFGLELSNKRLLFAKNRNDYLYSEDYGITWEIKELPISLNWIDGAVGLGGFMIIAKDTDVCLFSFDGLSWKIRQLPESNSWTGVTYAYNMRKFLIYSDQTTKYYSSNNTIMWTAHDRENQIPWTRMKYISDSKLIGICKGYVTYSTSTDGISWDENNEFDSPRKYIDIYDNGNYVILTSENDRTILVSQDSGISWDIYTLPIANSRWRMFYASNKYFLLGESTDIALISTNGKDFYQVSLSFIHGNWVNLWSVDKEDVPTVFYVPIPERNQLAYSYDGVFWYRASHIDRLEYGNGFFVAIDLATQTEEETLIHYSRGGYTWEKVKIPFGGNVKDITFGDGRFIIITDDSCDYVYQTLNMTKWEKLYLNLVTNKKFIAYSDIGDGFSVLTDREDVHLIHDNVKVQESQLFESMNQIIGACGTTIVILDYSALNIWICKDTNYVWKNTGLIVNADNSWNIKSLSTSIIAYCNEVFYCYNIFTEQWTEIEWEFEEIVAVEEVTVLLDHKTVRKIAIIADNHLFFMDGAYSTDKSSQFTVDFDNGYDLSLVPISIDAPIFDMCPNPYDKSIHLITEDIIYSIHDFNSDYTYSVETLIMPNIRGAKIQGVKLANNRYMMITDSHYFYISTDSINWKEYEFIDNMIPTKIMSTNKYFTGYINDAVNQYIFYTENGKDIRYQNFSLLYGNGSDVTTTTDDIYITKYSDILTKLKFGETRMSLSHDGVKDNIDYHIHPKKPSFDSGSFIKTENVYIQYLNFTPNTVIVKSVPQSSSEDFEEIILSKEEMIYQGISSDINKTNRDIKLVSNINTGTTLHGKGGSRIIHNGFIIETDKINMRYSYYAY